MEKDWLVDLIKDPPKTGQEDWLKKEIKYKRLATEYDKMFDTPIKRTGQTGVGESMFDDKVPYEELENLNEIRSQRQPWIAKFGAGVGRVGTKALTEIAKMPGVVGGIIGGAVGQIEDAITGEDNTDFMQTAFNNAWVKSLNHINETVNKELLPVYVSKAVSEGNLWDALSSIEFWATEGADGLGYIASMLVPGALINKFGLGSKLLGVNKLAKMAEKTEEATKALSKAKFTAKRVDLHTATLANTIFEAGAEAQSAMEGFENSLKQRLNDGEITQEQYDAEIGKASEIGRNIFWANAIILIGPNASMSKMLWGKPRNRSANVITNKGSKQLEEIAAPSFLKKIQMYGDDFGKAGAKEGFWEEGMQSTAEQYFSENPDSTLLDFVSDLPEAYASMITETDGQKAIALGMAFGGGMQAYTGGESRKSEREVTNKLIKYANSALTDMYNVFEEDIYEKDQEGNIIYEADQPKINFKKLSDKLKSQSSLESLSAMYDMAIEQDDKTTVEQIKDMVSTHLIKSFLVNDNLGLDILEQHLKESDALIPVIEREKTDRESYIKSIMDKARSLKDSYNSFQDFAPNLIKLEHKDATDQNKVDFYNKLSMEYIDAKSRRLFLDNKLKSVKDARSKVLKEKNLPGELVTEDEVLLKAEANDSRLKLVNDQIRSLESSIKESDTLLEEFWDNKKVNEYFAKEVDAEVAGKEIANNKEKLDAELNKVKAAKTPKEVNEIVSTDPIVNNAKKNRLKELKKEKETSDAEKKASNEEFINNKPDDTEKLTRIKDNYNVGEFVMMPDGTEAKIKSISDTNIVVEIPSATGVKSRNYTIGAFLEQNIANSYSTETSGPPQVPNPNVKANTQGAKGQTDILTTDFTTSEKLSFVSQAALDFERSPINKVGQVKTFQINVDGNLSSNQRLALDAYQAKDFSNKELLINHLPINIKLADGVVAPIKTKSEKSEKYNELFNDTTYNLRSVIINELEAGTPLEAITTEITGQYDGDIQIESEVLENSLLGLYEIAGNIKNITVDKLYVVNDNGIPTNHKGDIITTSKGPKKGKGEIYMLIHTAAGKPFPLKLNIKRMTTPQAEVIYEIYKYEFDNPTPLFNTKLVDTNDSLIELVKNNLPNELALFAKNKKPLKDLTLLDIVDFITWTESTNLKTQIRFNEKNELLVLDKVYTKEMFSTAKEDVINAISENKRHHIKAKRKKGEGVNSLNFENKSYLEYLVNNRILNTNAVVDKPTFAGRTTMFISTDKVKVNGKLSKFNKPVFVSKPKPAVKKEPVVKANEDAEAFSATTTNDLDLSGITGSSGIDITKFGVPAPKPKIEVPKLSVNDFNKALEQLQKFDVISTNPFKFEGGEYFITRGTYYVIDFKNKTLIENLGFINRLVEAYNKEEFMASFRINLDQVNNVWKERLSTTVSETKITSPEVNFSNITNEQAPAIMLNITKAYSAYIKQIMQIVANNKNLSEKDKVVKVLEFLQSKNISKEELKTKCNL
jgi:hypothetical protein